MPAQQVRVVAEDADLQQAGKSRLGVFVYHNTVQRDEPAAHVEAYSRNLRARNETNGTS